MDPDQLAGVFSERPALHRFPAANAKRVQELCRIVVDEYDGRAARRLGARPATATSCSGGSRPCRASASRRPASSSGLLGKQLGVRPPGWEEAAGTFGQAGHLFLGRRHRRPGSLARVRAYKQQMKAAAKAQAEPRLAVEVHRQRRAGHARRTAPR